MTWNAITSHHQSLAGLRLPARERLARALNLMFVRKYINRSDICAIGEVSVAQAACDIREIKARFPGLIRYDATNKRYVFNEVDDA